MDILWKIFSPLKYMKIRHPQRRVVDYYAPLLLSAVTIVIYQCLPVPFVVFGEKGLLTSVSSLLQFLTGFYVASLVAIATFPNKNMDEVTNGIPLKLDDIKITRRQYLSYMFGYLALLGFGFVLFGFVVKALEPSLPIWLKSVSSTISLVGKLLFISIYSFYLSRLFLTTLYGLYYLTEKIHQEEAELTGEIGNASNTEDADIEDSDIEDFK